MRFFSIQFQSFFLFRSDIDIIEWSHFLTPQLELSKLFQASPVGFLLSFQVSTHFSCNDLNVLFHLKGDASEPVISALNDCELEQMENMRGRLHQLAKVT